MPHCPSVHSKPASRRTSARLRILLGTLLGGGLLLPIIGVAPAQERHAFDRSSGESLMTLEPFAAQSDSQRLYSPDDAQRITTPPSGRTL